MCVDARACVHVYVFCEGGRGGIKVRFVKKWLVLTSVTTKVQTKLSAMFPGASLEVFKEQLCLIVFRYIRVAFSGRGGSARPAWGHIPSGETRGSRASDSGNGWCGSHRPSSASSARRRLPRRLPQDPRGTVAPPVAGTPRRRTVLPQPPAQH